MAEEGTITLGGKVGRVFFSNPEGPFTAGVLQVDGGEDKRFAGKVFAEAGDVVELTGSWGRHPKYGPQFEAQSGVVKMDESPEALVHLLATRKEFKGLGVARARRVVDAALALSDDGDVGSSLVAYPQEIAERAGVKLDIVAGAAEAWQAKRSYFEALAALVDQGWSNAQASKIVARFGEGAPAMVRSDPYMLIGKLARFGFRTVDVVARKMGIPSTAPFRLAAGVAYCIDRIANDGNTWTSREGLVHEAMEELKPDTLDGERLVREAIERLIDGGSLCVSTSPLGSETIADTRLAQSEVMVFNFLVRGLGETLPELGIGARAQAVLGTLNGDQARAFAGFSRSRVSVISGRAGVGKTYTMRAICEVVEENGLRVALCAPTGKAARKLEHATGREAKTIHRLLEPVFDETSGSFTFTRTARNPVEADLVVVDEVSMVDVRLMAHLVAALRPSCRLLCVGDHNQIPSVGPGAILRDLLAARDRYPDSVHVLSEVVRQAGVLALNTTALLDGVVVFDVSEPWGVLRTEKGNEQGTEAMVAAQVEAVVTSPQPLQPFGRELDLAFDVQVLAPRRGGVLGTYALNVHLQKLRQRLMGNAPPEKTEPGRPPKPLVGDRVISTQNDYELDLLNGTQAVVVELPKGGGLLLFTEDGREVEVPSSKRDRVEVAYAMTIHKAQGSEWPYVVLVASSSHWYMHDRNLLYTGASRAAEALTIVGDAAGMKHFAKELKSERRQTFGSFIVHGWNMEEHSNASWGVAAE